MSFAADKGTFLAFSAENGEQAIARKRTLPEVIDGGGGGGLYFRKTTF